MNATIVIYGSSTGTCEAIAEKIAQKLGCEVINVQDLTAEVVNNNQNLILGTSTWGAGELQDDWYDGLKILQQADLSGKTIALFGCGDCESYGDTFVGGIGELYNGIKASGATFVGSVDTDGYTFDDSEAVVDGKFVGLPLDDVNEDDKTDTRIEAWIADITSSAGRMSAALRGSANFMTRFSQVMLERMSTRNGDLKPMVRLSPL